MERRIRPVKSLYKSSFNCATCAARAASALPTMTVLAAAPLPFTALPGVLPYVLADSTLADVERTAASLAARALFSAWVSARVVLSVESWASAVERED